MQTLNSRSDKVDDCEMRIIKNRAAKLSAQLWIRRYGLVALTYICATWLTNAHFMADTADYVDSIVERAEGADYRFWEFGHLLWRPLGWVLCQVFYPLTSAVVGPDTRPNVIATLLAINWLAGFACVMLLRALINRVCARTWISNTVTISFIFSQGFLNFAQTGSSYIPGLAFLLGGLYLLAKEAGQPEHHVRTMIIAGATLALSVCLWVPYLWAILAALSLPLFLFGFDRERRRLVIGTALAFAATTGLTYLLVLASLGIYNVAELKTWITESSHGNDTSGVVRMIFGFARSFINMGNDGMLVKRFLLHDPLNPVSLGDLLRLSLWKVGLFYFFLAAITIGLLRGAHGRRVLGLLILNAAPVVAFATLFDGGAIERYLPLYPLVFLALAYSLREDQSARLFKLVTLTFVAAFVLVNVNAMSTATLNRQQEAAASRIEQLQSELKPPSRVFTVSWLDELVNFNRSFPLHRLNERNTLRLTSLVTPGTTQVAHWQQDFASQALATWAGGGDVWISQRAFNQRPRFEWNWVEGDDRRVRWSDFPNFFAQLETGRSLGGEDGFTVVLHTPYNEQLLTYLARHQ